MSHFAGLVIITPEYGGTHDIDDALSKYDENLEVGEYSRGEVDDFDKICFIEYYRKDDVKGDLAEELYDILLKNGKIGEYKDDDWKSYLYRLKNEYQGEYADVFKSHNQDLFDMFEEIYAEKGNDWNGCSWRINYETGKWEEYSTYNPDSQWDWYSVGGRWDKSIKIKSGELVNECLLEEIDWSDFKPEDYEEEEKTSWNGRKYHDLKEGIEWHFTKSDMPFCFVIDGQWIEKGSMGWWGITSNEMADEEWTAKMFEILERLPQESEVTLIDFHI